MDSSGDVNGNRYDLSKILEEAKFIILDPDVPMGKDGKVDYDQEKLFNVINDSYENGERTQIYKGLEYLRILCDEQDVDSPEFVDVAKLSPRISEESSDDDVIFVSEYKQDEVQEADEAGPRMRASEQDQNCVRRNPMRNARSKSRNFCKDLIFEDEFGFLDSSSDEETAAEIKVEKHIEPIIKLPLKPLKKISSDKDQSPVRKSTTTPECSPEPKTVEQHSPKTKTRVTVKKNCKKNYTRGSRRRAAVQKKWYVHDLQETVNETTKMFSAFVNRARILRQSNEEESHSFNFTDCIEALKNQAILYSVVNGGEKFDFEFLRNLNDDCDEKLQD